MCNIMSIGGVRLDAKETIKALLEASEDGTIKILGALHIEAHK